MDSGVCDPQPLVHDGVAFEVDDGPGSILGPCELDEAVPVRVLCRKVSYDLGRDDLKIFKKIVLPAVA